MRRRRFLAAAGTAGIAVSGRAMADNPVKSPASVREIAGKPAEGILAEYRAWLFDDFLPFMDRFVIDREYGGFMARVDRDGTRVNTGKWAAMEGRGVWVYSRLYNAVDRDPRHLETARRSVEFIIKRRPPGGGRFPASFTREGEPTAGPSDIYGDLFIALGLQEYAKASGEERFSATAKDIILRRLAEYDSPDYSYSVSYAVPDGAPPPIVAPRVLGHWMVLLDIATRMLEASHDPDIEQIADRCVDAVMHRHFNPDFRLQNEVLNHDLSRNPQYAGFSYTGHAIETYWMVMREAVRRGDRALWDAATERFRRHVEVAWDDVYGGAFRALYDVDRNLWATDKVSWLQEEILIGAMLMIVHADDSWAREWFGRTWGYMMEKFALRRHGFPLWNYHANRKADFELHAGTIEMFHHPRHLMENIVALEALVKHEGKLSGIFH